MRKLIISSFAIFLFISSSNADDEAFMKTLESARAGHHESIVRVAQRYECESIEKAEVWWLKASEKGDPWSLWHMGMLHDGNSSCMPDEEKWVRNNQKAYIWYALANAFGGGYKTDADTVMKMLSPIELDEARSEVTRLFLEIETRKAGK